MATSSCCLRSFFSVSVSIYDLSSADRSFYRLEYLGSRAWKPSGKFNIAALSRSDKLKLHLTHRSESTSKTDPTSDLLLPPLSHQELETGLS